MKQVCKPKKKAIMLTLSEKIWPLSRVLYSFTVTGGSRPWLSALLFLRMSEVYREFEAKIMEIKVEHDFWNSKRYLGFDFLRGGIPGNLLREYAVRLSKSDPISDRCL